MQETIITSRPDTISQYLKKIWKYRVLIWVFAKRDIRVKYAQTLLGIGWSIAQPLTAMLVFSYFFGYLLNWKTADIPFPLYVFSGLIGWNFFSYIINSGTSSVQDSSNLIRKIYFPKTILPLSKVIVAFTEFAISLCILIPMIYYFDRSVSWRIAFIPLALLFNAICALTLVFWVAAFAYRKRDLLHILPFVVYFGIWITPVFFSIDILPAKVQKVVVLNPMANVIELWRWIFLGSAGFNYSWIISFVVVSFLCLSGMFFYNRKENQFSDFA